MRLSDQHVGNTGIYQLSDKLFVKLEFMNPTGSIKDRPATFIINDAEKRKLLKKGDTIIEATSGNMGISFAWLAAERGYNCKIVMPSNMSEERKQMLKLYGAELIEVEPGNFDGAIKLRDELAKKNGWFNCNQFASQMNIQAHSKTTAPEIISELCTNRGLFIEAFVTGTGTGGTLMGAGLTLKEKIPMIRIIAVEPSESPVMSGGQPGLHGIQGIGDGSKFLVDMNKVDEIITISTEDAKDRARKLARETGFFVGISAAANVLASERWIEKNNPHGVVVTFLCDRGERYLSCL
jgi:cysteine synthase